jgi:hypothetical protein
MSKDTSQWNKEFTKGKIAENIFSFLVKSMPDWECIPYGMENHIQTLKELLRNNKEDVSFNIRTMPDFIVANKKEKRAYFIDVKYRDFIDGREPNKLIFNFPYGQLKDYLKYWANAYIVIIHDYEPYFYIIPVSKIEWHKHLRDRYEHEGKVVEHWDFNGIVQDIKTIFPTLKDTTIKEAIALLPRTKAG